MAAPIRGVRLPREAMFTSVQIFFLQLLVPTGAKLGPSKEHTKSHKSRKTPHQNAFLIEACKKTPSGSGQTSEFHDGYALSAVFSGAQGSQKEVEMEPPGIQNHKKSKKVGTQNNSEKQHCKKWVCGRILTSNVACFFAPGASPKSHKSEISSKWAPRRPK